jgi:hypothetical protein
MLLEAAARGSRSADLSFAANLLGGSLQPVRNFNRDGFGGIAIGFQPGCNLRRGSAAR